MVGRNRSQSGSPQTRKQQHKILQSSKPLIHYFSFGKRRAGLLWVMLKTCQLMTG
jgi:hypothetical protein